MDVRSGVRVEMDETLIAIHDTRKDSPNPLANLNLRSPTHPRTSPPRVSSVPARIQEARGKTGPQPWPWPLNGLSANLVGLYYLGFGALHVVAAAAVIVAPRATIVA